MKTLLMILCTLICVSSFAQSNLLKLPEEGALVGAYVDSGPMADKLTVEKIKEYEARIGKKLVWTYFSDNWIDGVIEFPSENVQACDEAGTIPYIRLNPWTEARTYQADDWLNMQNILDGSFDVELKQWAKQARAYEKLLIVEFGPEVNGDWFPWNGKWNGGGSKEQYGDPNLFDGPERYRDVYRKIIEIFREVGATNVVWVFHVDTAWSPWRKWNRAANYYPGDEYIDWIGLSVFGRQLPKNDWLNFEKKLSNFWEQVEEISLEKPVIISEFAVIEDKRRKNRKAKWLSDALKALRTNKKFKRVKAISYWDSPGFLANAKADMRLTSSGQSLDAFTTELQNSYWIGRDEYVEVQGE